MTRRRDVIHPRMLTKAQAADYCGLSVSAFEQHCPVLASALGPEPCHRRYDVKLLDVWLDKFGPDSPTQTADHWLRELEKAL